MKKLFISQPMNGLSQKEILTQRQIAIESAIRLLGDDDVQVIDSYFPDAPDDATPLWYLGKALQLMSQADVAYFATGWQDARGCKIEHLCAVNYNIPIIEGK